MEIFLPDWYDTFFEKLMNLRCYKLLVLAGIDRLEQELTVGPMQSKFTSSIILNKVLACLSVDFGDVFKIT
jgi:hypothetical protein